MATRGRAEAHAPLSIRVFDAEEESSPEVASKQIVEQRSAAATYVQIPCRPSTLQSSALLSLSQQSAGVAGRVRVTRHRAQAQRTFRTVRADNTPVGLGAKRVTTGRVADMLRISLVSSREPRNFAT